MKLLNKHVIVAQSCLLMCFIELCYIRLRGQSMPSSIEIMLIECDIRISVLCRGKIFSTIDCGFGSVLKDVLVTLKV